jgi:hypothetical protein
LTAKDMEIAKPKQHWATATTPAQVFVVMADSEAFGASRERANGKGPNVFGR